MITIEQLIEQLKTLSPEDQQQVADFVDYLRWRAGRQAGHTNQWSYSFIEKFKQATVQASGDPAGMDVQLAPASVGNESRPAIWAHPPVTGRSGIEYHVPIPQQVSDVHLRLAIGIRDGAEISADSLVAFAVRVNGARVWGDQSNARTWQQIDIPLDLPAGDIVRLELTTEALGSHEWNWAVWGQPELVGW